MVVIMRYGQRTVAEVGTSLPICGSSGCTVRVIS